MKDAQLEKLKQEFEADLGRPLEVEEEIEVKALFYFSKGVKLKNQLDSEPERLGDVCERVLIDIRRRMEQQRRSQHRRRVVCATRDFLSGKRPGRQDAGKKVKIPAKQRFLFDGRDE